MMKLTHIAYPLCIITLLVALLPACSNRDAFEAMRLNEQDIYLGVGDSLQLGYTKVEAEDENASITWKSSNSDVATVDADGLVVARTEGQAVITSHSGRDEASCVVHVVTYGFKNAVLFDTPMPGHFKLLLSATPPAQPPANGQQQPLLVLEVVLPADSTNIVSGHYPLSAGEDAQPPCFLPGNRVNGSSSCLLGSAKQDTLFVHEGQFDVYYSKTYLIHGELTTDDESTFSFMYEGVVPSKEKGQEEGKG